MLDTFENTTLRKSAYSIKEIADLTSLSKGFLRNEIKTRKLKAKSFGRRVLVLEADFLMWLESQEDWTPSST